MSKNKRFSRILRVLIPLLVVFVWLGLSGIGGPYFGKISDVASNDLSSFLPSSAESTKVSNKLKKFNDSSTIPAIIIFESKSGLTSVDKTKLASARQALNESKVVDGEVGQPVISDDNKAAILVAPLHSNSEFDVAIISLKNTVANAHTGMTYKITGPAMFSRDLNKAFAGIDGTLLFVALGVVFLILLLVYRLPILPIVTLFVH